jgi:hypothetical protein
MLACVFVYTHVCMWVYICVCVYMCMCVCVYECFSLCLSLALVLSLTHTRSLCIQGESGWCYSLRTCHYVYQYVCMYVSMYVCMYDCIDARAHTHRTEAVGVISAGHAKVIGQTGCLDGKERPRGYRLVSVPL